MNWSLRCLCEPGRGWGGGDGCVVPVVRYLASAWHRGFEYEDLRTDSLQVAPLKPSLTVPGFRASKQSCLVIRDSHLQRG